MKYGGEHGGNLGRFGGDQCGLTMTKAHFMHT